MLEVAKALPVLPRTSGLVFLYAYFKFSTDTCNLALSKIWYKQSYCNKVSFSEIPQWMERD